MKHPKGARRGAALEFHSTQMYVGGQWPRFRSSAPSGCSGHLSLFSTALPAAFWAIFCSSVVFGTDGLSTNPVPGREELIAFGEFCESDSVVVSPDFVTSNFQTLNRKTL
jgi:hypothetical protein